LCRGEGNHFSRAEGRHAGLAFLAALRINTARSHGTGRSIWPSSAAAAKACGNRKKRFGNLGSH
jgi:hypothetical protein